MLLLCALSCCLYKKKPNNATAVKGALIKRDALRFGASNSKSGKCKAYEQHRVKLNGRLIGKISNKESDKTHKKQQQKCSDF